MSLRNGVLLLVALTTIAALVACGNNGVATGTCPPSGCFSAKNLNGTYVFSASGTDGNGGPYAIVGSFTANGSGGITGGSIDLNDQSLGALQADVAIGSQSSYTVGVDGRGQATLANGTQFGTITLDFALENSFHGVVTEFDNDATGSGTLDVQTAGITPAGAYAFLLFGTDSNSDPSGMVGNFTVGNSGSITGLADVNQGSFAQAGLVLTGTVVAGPSTNPATVLTTSGTVGSQAFDVYTIDANHLKFIELDTLGTLSGDAYSQSTGIPSGATTTYAFTVEGSYPSATSFSAVGGFLVTDGSGNITDASTQDVNNEGSVTSSPLPFSGTYTAAGTGRYTLNLSQFSDGAQFAAYPSSGGIFLLEIDSSGIMAGAAYPQSSTTFAGDEGYALNLSGENSGQNTGNGTPVEVDNIAAFTATSSNSTLAGVIDENYEPAGFPNYGIALSGQYTTPDSNGRGSISASAGNLNNSTLNGGFNLNYYTVDGATFPFIELDSGQVSAGVLIEQNATATSDVAKPHLFVMRPMFRPRGARKKRQ
jgi:hypothetical protein